MLSDELRARIKALKRSIPDGRALRSNVVVDLRRDPVIDISDGRNDPAWIQDDRVVDLFPETDPVPKQGLGAVPPLAAPVFRTLARADRELAHLVAAGFSDEEIALVLDMTHGAVELAIRSLLGLSGYTTRPELIVAWHAG